MEFVGHPLIDAIHNQASADTNTFRAENHLSDKPIIAILPSKPKAGNQQNAIGNA